MVFVIVSNCREELTRLTQLLLSSFPGSTIYQHAELCRVTHDVLNNKVDAVLLDVELDKSSGLDFVRMLRKQKTNVPVFIIAKAEDFREEAMDAGADDYCVLPDGKELLLDAIQLVKNKKRLL